MSWFHSGYGVLALIGFAVCTISQAQPRPTPKELSFAETVDVHLFEIAATVISPNREVPIELEEADFSLRIADELVPISTFSPPHIGRDAELAATEDLAIPPLRLMVILDSSRYRRETLVAFTRDVMAEITTMATRTPRSSAHLKIAIVAIDEFDARLVQAFTDDLDLIASGFRTVAESTLSSSTSDYRELLTELQRTAATSSDPGEVSRASRARILAAKVGAYSARRGQQAKAVVDSCRRVVDMVAGLEGDKAILLISQTLEIDPAASLLQAMRNAGDALRDSRPRASLPLTLPAGDSGSQEAIMSLADHAAELAIPLYSYFGAPHLSSAGDLTAPRPAAGTGGAPGSDDLYSPSLSSTAQNTSFADASRLLARRSGGRALEDSRSMIEAIATSHRSTFRLGFAAKSRPDRHEVHVAIRGVNPSRVSYRLVPTSLDTDQGVALRTRAAIFDKDSRNPLAIQVIAASSGDSTDRHHTVDLTIRIPFSRIVVRPKKDTHFGKLSIFLAELRPDFRTTPVKKLELPIHLRHDQLADAAGRDAELRTELDVSHPDHTIAIGVRDDFGSSVSIMTVRPP